MQDHGDHGHSHSHHDESTHDLTVGVSSLDQTSSGVGKPSTLQSGFYRDKHHHSHDQVNAQILSSEKGIWAAKWSFIGLIATTILQAVVVVATGSVALLADTLHNLADAFTSIPLWVAFVFSKRKPTPRFTYGYGKIEDVAGLLIVGIIFLSAIVVFYESAIRLLHPQKVEHLWAVAAASLVGFIGNEAVAFFRIRVGKKINSAAMVADGYHARADGLTSLAVLFSTAGIALGFPLADPLIGLVISILIVKIGWESSKNVFIRLIDGVDPKILQTVKSWSLGVEGVEDIQDLQARWTGHKLRIDLSIVIDPLLTVEKAHEIGSRVRRAVLDNMDFVSAVTVHTDPKH